MIRTILFVFLLLTSALSAETLELGSPFSEHMVLQRELPVPVWGRAEPGALVEVSVAGIEESIHAGKDGRWKIELSRLPTGGPYTFHVSSGVDEIKFKDVLVGEVWICSGQSNMQFNRKDMIGVDAMLKSANGRPLRSMHVKQDVSFEPADRCEGLWTTEPSTSAVAFAFSLNLQQALDVPVGVIVTCWGSSSIEGWMPLDMIQQLPHFGTLMNSFEQNDHERVARLIKDRAEGKQWILRDDIFLRTRPNILYNAMLHPLAPYAARGIVWYQGEANAKSIASMLQYGKSLPLWCRRLAKLWNREDFHILVVMLPKFANKVAANDPNAPSWAWFREGQLKLPEEYLQSGVANTIDLGDANNIHPKDKASIGQRLAWLALRDVNGRNIEAEGPVFTEAKVVGQKIALHFNHADGLTTTDAQSPRSFWIAGTNRIWFPATASIQGGRIILESDDVRSPKFVRYAFTGVPDTNLINSAKLPATPFRTDDFPR